ncbi:MAG: SOS mutagenesis and repair protein UmuC, partial [Candidatus Zixiibacteriota bacterium]
MSYTVSDIGGREGPAAPPPGRTRPGSRRFALVDCDNFYVSCERVFNPSLVGRPVVVLSNNDGCIISRSAEAKSLGIKMGAPLHHVTDIISAAGVAVRSSNYALYGDMSRRVLETLAGFTPQVEVYSIDEAFLGLDGCAPSGADLSACGREIHRRVLRWTGL